MPSPRDIQRASIPDSSRPGQSIELEYEVLGAGPPLVWLHGLSGSLTESQPLCDRLAQHFTVLTYSTRGHGGSNAVYARAHYTYDVIAQDLASMLAHVGWSQPVLAGGSHGANTILRHEVLFPGVAKGLVLIAPGGNALARPARLKWAALRAHLKLLDLRYGEDGIIRAITGQDPQDPNHDAVAVAAAHTHEIRSLKSAMRFIADQQVLPVEALRSFAVPSIVAGWDNDPLIHPIAVARRIAAEIPGARFEQIKRLAAMESLAAAEAAAAKVAEWARQLSG